MDINSNNILTFSLPLGLLNTVIFGKRTGINTESLQAKININKITSNCKKKPMSVQTCRIEYLTI